MSAIKGIKWSLDGFHRPFSVACTTSPGVNRYHYVFTLPASVLRHKATNFAHFRTTHDAKRYKICFHFFLDFIQAMVGCSEKKKPMSKGMNTLGFIEWCPSSDSKTQLNTAGWRLHVFVDRQFSEMTVLKTLVSQFSKESDKLQKSRKPVPEHYRISTLASYASSVYSVYSGKVGNVEQLYQNIESGCSVSPSALFCMKDMEGSVYDLDDYKNETNEFVFPSSNFMRLDTETISVKHFASRKLPDHVLFSIAKPEVRVSRSSGLCVEFLPHRYYKEYHGDWDEDKLKDFVEMHGHNYNIFEEGSTRNVFDIGEVTYSKMKSVCVWMETRGMDEMLGPASAAYEKMRANQHDLDTLDHITLLAMEKEDKNQFIDEEFNAHVYNDDDCFASKPLKAVIRWFHKEYNPDLIHPYPLVHEGMSVFGHRACILMDMYHHLYQVSSAHRLCYWIHVARCDAFRHQHNLHLNCAITGDAATSKSFLFELMEKNSINETVSCRTYDTDKSDAIDSDKDHVVSVFDEAPPGFFKDPKKRGPLEALKMRLTIMKTVHRRLFTNEETGIREQIESTSSNIGCLMGATNEARSNFDKPLQTRFHFFEAEKSLNTKHSVSNCQHAAETMGGVQRKFLQNAIMFHRFEQGYVALVWQFIRLGRIKEPSTLAVGIVTRRFFEVLKKDYDISVGSRTIERIKRLSQNLAIIRAKQILYHTNTGMFANVPFHPSQIPAAEEHMYCTEEIVIHAIGLEFDAIVSRNKRRILQKIWNMHKKNEAYKTDDKGDDDVNYICIEGNVGSFSKRLMNAMLEDNVHVSVCNIRTVFDEIKDQTISCEEYSHGSETFGDGMPGYATDSDSGGARLCKRWAAMEESGGHIYLHIELFKDLRTSNQEQNIYKLTAMKMMHRHTRNKKIVLGMNVFDRNEPNVWDTMEFSPKEGVVIHMSSGIGEVDDPYNVIGDTDDLSEDLTTDLDDYVVQAHAAEIGRDIEFYEPSDEDWSGRVIAYPYRGNKRKR